MRAHKDQDALGVITSNFTLYNNEMHALVDPSSIHSYICIKQLSDKLPSIESLGHVWYAGLSRINFVFGLGLIWSD